MKPRGEQKYVKPAPSRDAHKIYIVCEGEKTEPNYFAFFEGLSSNLQVIKIPSENGETDPLKLLKLAEQKFFGNDKTYSVDYSHGDTVWFVFDTDEWEKDGKITPLREFCEKQNDSITGIKQYPAWNAAQSNPSIEIWFYYHFYDTPPNDFDASKERFKGYVGKVLKGIGGFDCRKHPRKLETAIRNADANFHKDKGKVALFSTEMYLLGAEILPFVKSELDKLTNKLV